MSYLSPEQYATLLNSVNPVRVHQKDGLSHMEAYDIRAHLNRVFGFARWSADVVEMTLVSERVAPNKSGRDSVYVVYRAGLRLTVKAKDGAELASYTEYAAGDALGFPIIKMGDAHDFAMKTAESQALKRAAVNLGDQFGLSLYNKGSLNRIVVGTLNAVEPVKGEVVAEPVDSNIEVVAPEPEPIPDEDVADVEPVAEQGPNWTALILKHRNNNQELLDLYQKAVGLKAPQIVIDQIVTEGKKLAARTA